MTATVAPQANTSSHPRARWRAVRFLPWVAAGALLTVVIGWGLWFTIAWFRYGHPAATGASDPVLDRFMPFYEVAERHEIRVATRAAITYEAARSFDLERAGVVHAIFAGRHLLLSHTNPPRPHLTLGDLQAIGWGLLAERPGHEHVVGAITQPSRRDVQFRPLAPAAFAAFDSAGYVKIAWTLAVDSLGPAESRFRTETRALTTDGPSRARFRRYWAFFSPGILLIRWQAIRLLRAEAERRFRAVP
ncbi:MAG TPA: hypothetical protein VFU41_15465 [Gemmatimonadales bacterium]|nr:hypothetical protein [Gemmatimonadales bacterium]